MSNHKENKTTKIKMTADRSWEVFKETGLLWFINSILHLFGWEIELSYNKNRVVEAKPLRVTVRGFSERHNMEGYVKVSKYLKDNIDQLDREANYNLINDIKFENISLDNLSEIRKYNILDLG